MSKRELENQERLKRETEVMMPKKINKPLTEKKRRDRINKCLGQLKSLVIRAKGKDEKKCVRLEKADILEMAVEHLYNMRNQDNQVLKTESDRKYCEGYSQCISEVFQCLRFEQGIDTTTKTNLINHLRGSLAKLPLTNHVTGYDNEAFEYSNCSNLVSSSPLDYYPVNFPSSLSALPEKTCPQLVPSNNAEVCKAEQNIFMEFYNAPLDLRASEICHKRVYPLLSCAVSRTPSSPVTGQIGLPLFTSTPTTNRDHRVPIAFPDLDNTAYSFGSSSSSESCQISDPWRPW